MTAATTAPVRHRTSRAASAVPLSAARLLRVELRRNTMPWILPLIAALFWFDSYRPSTGTSPLYGLRTFWNMGQGHTILDFGPFVAGVAAWMGSRDGRRGLADLMTTTARPRWAAQLATWAATAIWAVTAYLVFVGVMFAVYAHQGVAGTPPWWYVTVGVTAVAAFSAVGFAIGAYWPSRFAAPVAAFGAFLAMFLSFQTGFSHTSGWALILPTNSNGAFDGSAQTDSGIFYPWLPDLPIARILFLAGIAVAALGLTGLPARAGGPWLRRAAAVLTLAGAALAGTAVGLASTAQEAAEGVVIPALHDAANDAPIAYTPVCGRAAGVPVCVNPAYRRWLPDVTAALAPVLAEVAGLPGAPVRAHPSRRGIPQRWRRTSPGDNVWRPAAGAPPVARLAQHAGIVRLLRGARGRESVRGPDAAAVRPRLRGCGRRLRQPGAAGRAGSAAARCRDTVRRAARADRRAPRTSQDPGRDRRPGRSTPRPGGSPPGRPRPGTPGSPLTWPRCGPADSPSQELP